jgi:hypothetical protein
MKDDFRQAYFEAREIIAQELKKKYNLIESFKDDNRLTLDSSKHSIHFTFYIPDGKDLNITKKGEMPDSDHSFLSYVFRLNQNDIQKTQNNLKVIFEPLDNIDEKDFYSSDVIIKSYQIEIQFLTDYFPYLFT